MKEYTFVLTEQEANLVLGALVELPHKVVNDLIKKIHEQAQKQSDEQATKQIEGEKVD